MVVLEVEVWIEHLPAGCFLIYAAEETNEGSSSRGVLDDLMYKLVKEERMRSVEKMGYYVTMGSLVKEGGRGCRYLKRLNGIQ